jgi:hypothetical protein
LRSDIRRKEMNKLSAEMFEEIIASLRSDRSLRANEKRNRPRVGLRAAMDVTFCTPTARGARGATVWVRDVSSVGLGLVGPTVMQPGLEFIATFERYDREPLRVQYTVAHCKMLARNLYSIGAKLLRVLPAEVVKPVRRAG